mmetsp:Transcript_135349/g.234739  ORF Transcript_135349/g.234739 Transcript_135349/m.234739 type:complete len:83 (-) Transcript_135349:3204-3452(-)
MVLLQLQAMRFLAQLATQHEETLYTWCTASEMILGSEPVQFASPSNSRKNQASKEKDSYNSLGKIRSFIHHWWLFFNVAANT